MVDKQLQSINFMLFLKTPIFLRTCNWQTDQVKSSNSSKYHSMAALFRPFLTLPSASNPCSKSLSGQSCAHMSFKTILRQSAVFETCHLWPFYGGSCMEDLCRASAVLGFEFHFMLLWPYLLQFLFGWPSLVLRPFSCPLRVWEEDLAGYNIRQFS